MQALLLTTGGTQKLRPLTGRIPSPLIPVLNRPIMVYNLELLGRLGFKRILVSVPDLKDRIERYFGDGQKWGVTLEYIFQPGAMGSAGALRSAKQLLQETFLVMPADEAADLELARAIRQHNARGAMATVIVQPGPPQGSRTLWVGADGRIRTVGSVPPGIPAWNDTGIYLFDPCVLDFIPPHLPSEIHQHLLPKLLSMGIPVFTCPLPGYWNPLNTLENFAEAQYVFLSRASTEKPQSEEKITYRYNALECRQIARGVWTGRNVMIHPKARIIPPVSIGHNSWIGRDAELGPAAIIGSNVLIDQGATVRHSIIFEGTYVGKLVKLENRLVNQGQLIDLCNHEEIRIADRVLLGKMDLQDVTPGIRRCLDICLAVLFILLSLPLALILGILLLLSTGRVFKRVTCVSPRPIHPKLQMDQKKIFDLLHFNTCRADGRPHGFGSWVESWEGQRLPELWNVIKGDLAIIGRKPAQTGAESRIGDVRQFEQDGVTGLCYDQAGCETGLIDVKVRAEDNVTVLDLVGSLDASGAGRLRRTVMDATARQPARVVVNLREVNFWDSSGLSVLVLGLKRAREKQGDLSLCCLQPSVRLIFELTRLDKVFEIFIREEDAVLAVANQA